MRSLAGRGEIEKALAAFDQFRNALADQVGVDPSPQTRALHVQLLSGSVTAAVEQTFRGPETAIRRLVSALGRQMFQSQDRARPGLVLLHGPHGSGRDSVADAACRRLGLGWSSLAAGPNEIPAQLARGDARHSSPVPEIVLCPSVDELSEPDVVALCEEARRQGTTLLVPTASLDPRVVTSPAQPADVTLQVVQVAPLPNDEVAR